MTEPIEQTLSRTEWVVLVKAKYPKAVIESFPNTSYAVIDGKDVGAHSVVGNYGWVI